MKELVAREEIFKEELESKLKEYNFDEASKFLSFYLLLLDFACRFKLITEDMRNKIAELITTAIYSETESKLIPTANYMYVLTMYLQTKSNWDAMQKLISIRSLVDAKAILHLAKEWLNAKVLVMQEQLLSCKNVVVSLKERNITNSYNELENELKGVAAFDVTEKFNLKVLHRTAIATEYLCLNENSTYSNFIECLQSCINSFYLEMQILNKVGAKNLLKKLKKELLSSEVEVVDASIKETERSLRKLEEEYKARVKEADDATYSKLDEMENNFRLEHPEISEEEFDDAFDEYLDSLEDDAFEDEADEDVDVLEEEYQVKKQELEEKLVKLENEAEKRERKRQKALFDYAGISLETIIKEYALFYKCTQGKLNYPETIEERGEIIQKIRTADAIDIFLKCSEFNFSDEEKKYLYDSK